LSDAQQHSSGSGKAYSPVSSGHSDQRQLIHAALVIDGDGRRFAPGALLVEPGRVIAAGAPAHIGQVDGVFTNNLQRFVVMPGLVNAHSHLDLTHIGVRRRDEVPERRSVAGTVETPKRRNAETPTSGQSRGTDEPECPIEDSGPWSSGDSGGFVEWVNMIRAERATEPPAIRDSVQHGAMLARAGGTALIGDIAGIGSAAAVEALRDSGLPGVSYLEVFGMGRRQQRGIEMMRAAIETIERHANGVRLGVQPHAPYSAGPEVYRAAAATGLPTATHLAETPEELEFVRTGGGPFRALLQQIGVWDESIRGFDAHPVEALGDVLRATPMVAAHVNYISDAERELLAEWPVSVAYCPRASAYFGHPHDGESEHRYRDMIEAGINVALGTDSIVCLDTPNRISVLDEMRLLYARDGTDPDLLLRMATVNGANALHCDPNYVTFAQGAFGGAIAVEVDPASDVDPLAQALDSTTLPVWV